MIGPAGYHRATTYRRLGIVLRDPRRATGRPLADRLAAAMTRGYLRLVAE